MAAPQGQENQAPAGAPAAIAAPAANNGGLGGVSHSFQPKIASCSSPVKSSSMSNDSIQYQASNYSLFTFDFEKLGQELSPVMPDLAKRRKATKKRSHLDYDVSPTSLLSATKRQNKNLNQPKITDFTALLNAPSAKTDTNELNTSVVSTDMTELDTSVASTDINESNTSFAQLVPKIVSTDMNESHENKSIAKSKPQNVSIDVHEINNSLSLMSVSGTASPPLQGSSVINNIASISDNDVLIDNNDVSVMNESQIEHSQPLNVSFLDTPNTIMSQEMTPHAPMTILNSDKIIIKSILKPNNAHTLHKTKHKSVVFQAAQPPVVQIPDNIVGPWRRARTLLSNASKAQLRAEHYGSLRSLSLPTLWSVGLGKIPTFMVLDQAAKTALVTTKRTAAQATLHIMQDCLQRKADQDMQIGSTFRTAYNALFPTPALATPANELLDSLLLKDRQTTLAVLNGRQANLVATPVTDAQILSVMVTDNSGANATAPAPPAPVQAGRGRGRGRGRGAYGGAPAPRSPSPGRGRGRGRGGRARGRGQRSRSRSPPTSQFSLSLHEQAVIQALRRN